MQGVVYLGSFGEVDRESSREGEGGADNHIQADKGQPVLLQKDGF